MTEIFTLGFWKAAAERALRAFAWAAIGTLASAQAGILEADWTGAVSVAGMALVLSLLASVAGDAFIGPGPSLLNAEVPAVPTRRARRRARRVVARSRTRRARPPDL